MDPKYKAIPYTAKTHHAAVEGTEPWDSIPAYDTRETRYCIVSTETGEILVAKGSWGPDYKFDAKQVKELLQQFDLHPDFTAAELLRMWEKG